MKKKVVFLVLGVVLLAAAGLAAWQYWQSARYGEAELLDGVTVQPEAPALGEVVQFSAECRVPWGQSVRRVQCRPGAGWVPYGTPRWTTEGVERTARRVRVSMALRPYRTGELAPGSAEVVAERPMFAQGARQITFPLTLPKVAVKPLAVEPGSELPIAGALPPPMAKIGRIWWIGGMIVIVLAILAAWLLGRRRRKRAAEIVLPPWVVARGELAKLRQTAETGDRPLPWCVARLTDVVRDYLSARFAWPVTQQTTGEFLNSLRRAKTSPLSVEQMHRLGDFMNAADLVKFAKIEPDAGYFRDAMQHAETLIDETQLRPAPEAEKEAAK